MALDGYKNLAISQVVTPPSPPTTGTSITVGAGHGARFPTPPFNATVWPIGSLPDPSIAEIVRVTGIASDTLTITRTAEGPGAARTIVVGDYIAATLTAKWIGDLTNADNLSAGTVPDARLSANVARRDQANTFAGGLQEMQIAGTAYFQRYRDTAQTTGNRAWNVVSASGDWYLQPADDAGGAQISHALHAKRDGSVEAFKDLYEKSRVTPVGHWIAVPFNAANFTASAGLTWTVAAGNILQNSYTLIGKTLIWMCLISGSTLSGSGANLFIVTPVATSGNWFTAPTSLLGLASGNEAGTVQFSPNQAAIGRLNGSNFAAGTCNLYFTVVIPLP